MLQVAEAVEALLDDAMAAAAVHVDDERHATGVMFEGGVIQALRPWGEKHAPSSSWSWNHLPAGTTLALTRRRSLYDTGAEIQPESE